MLLAVNTWLAAMLGCFSWDRLLVLVQVIKKIFFQAINLAEKVRARILPTDERYAGLVRKIERYEIPFCDIVSQAFNN